MHADPYIPEQQIYSISVFGSGKLHHLNDTNHRRPSMAAEGTKQAVKIGELIRKASSDKELKARLVKDSVSVFKENGISIPTGMTVKVLEDTDTVYHFIIPPKPDNAQTPAGAGSTAGKGAEQLLFRVWSDMAFKKSLIANTMKVLKENGIVVPEGMTIKALENTNKVIYLVIPRPQTGELSDADLDKVAGGRTPQKEYKVFCDRENPFTAQYWNEVGADIKGFFTGSCTKQNNYNH
jgi:hypothetical protein